MAHRFMLFLDVALPRSVLEAGPRAGASYARPRQTLMRRVVEKLTVFSMVPR